MNGMKRFIHRLLNVIRGRRATEELTREITSHLAVLEAEHRRRGLSPDEARFAARRTMGSVALIHDLHRDARSFVRLEDLGRDFRHAVRTLRRAPGFSLIAIFALGLGIGVNTTFFTIVNAICLRGLPIESPERVMYVSGRDAQDRTANLSYLEFDELRSRTTAFERVAAYTITVAVVADARTHRAGQHAPAYSQPCRPAPAGTAARRPARAGRWSPLLVCGRGWPKRSSRYGRWTLRSQPRIR